MIRFRNIFLTIICALSLSTVASTALPTNESPLTSEVATEFSSVALTTEKLQTEASTQTPFADQINKVGDNYADKVLAKDTSFLGSVGRHCLKFIIINAFSLVTSDGNRAATLAMLANEGLIEAGVYADAALIRTHKNASWWQWFKAADTLDTSLPADYSDHVTDKRKIITTLWALWIARNLAMEKNGIFTEVTGLDGKEHSVEGTKINTQQLAGYFSSYIIAEVLRQKMIDKNDSPRKANIIAILASGAMNEIIKKVM
ncbi:hypothetical protein JKY79_02525 [Candidatus Babeliales bacterium]|nr:hypothetical protein [Candidatus Babeliales bacterium]